MNENEKEEIESNIEAKYVDKTEKEFLNRVTYAECLYILTPTNKCCNKIKELSVLKICEIIEKLQKENEEYSKQLDLDYVDDNYIAKQKIKDKMEELNKEIKNAEVTEAIFKIKQQQILQELIEEREEK